MEGQFLVRQIYDDEITYNLIGAAVELLSKYIYCAMYLNIIDILNCYFRLCDYHLTFSIHLSTLF